MPTLEELVALRRRVDVRIAADEVVRRAADPLRVDLREACDVVVLKVQPLGGVRAALRVAGAHGLPCVVSSALESSVGIAAGVALAAALPELPFACGLATVALFTDDVTSSPLLPVDGELPVRRPEPDRLDAVAADPVTEARWGARLDAVRPVNPSTAFGRVLVDELVRGGVTDAVLAPGSRSALSPSRWPPPSGTAGCGCTCGSTSGRRRSSPSAWPRRRGRCRCSPPPGRRRRTCTPRCSRPTPAGCPCWR